MKEGVEKQMKWMEEEQRKRGIRTRGGETDEEKGRKEKEQWTRVIRKWERGKIRERMKSERRGKLGEEQMEGEGKDMKEKDER